MIPVDGHPDLYRDPNSGAIINNNKSDATVIRESRKKAEQRLVNLENDMTDIKDMLKKLLKKKK